MLVLAPIFAILIWAGILFPPILAAFALFRWRAGWRIAALLPLPVLYPLLTHRFSGILFVPVALLLCSYSAAVALLHRRSSVRESHPADKL